MRTPNLNADFFKANRADIVGALKGPLDGRSADQLEASSLSQKLEGTFGFTDPAAENNSILSL